MFALETTFLVFAVVGGTVMVCQFVMTILGMGDDGGADAVDAGDFNAGDVGGDFGDAGDAGGDMLDDIADQSGARWGEAGDADVDHPDSSWLFSVISFRTIVAALAFFGLAGKASLAAGLDMLPALVVALAAGSAAMYGLFVLMRTIYRLRSEGTVRIRGAVGKRGTVYIPIPPNNGGVGKIQLNLQNRTVEYAAMADVQDKLPTGARVVVVKVLGPDTVEVQPIPETADLPSE